MRILFISSLTNDSGSAKRLWSIASELGRLGHQIHYLGVVLFPKDSFRSENRVEWVFEKEYKLNEILLEGLDKETWKAREAKK